MARVARRECVRLHGSVVGGHSVTMFLLFFFFSSRRRHTRFDCDWSSDVCSSDLESLMRKRFALLTVLCLSLAGLFVGLSANDQRDQRNSQQAGKRLGGKMSAAGQAARRRSRNVGLEATALGRIQELLGTKSPGKAQCAEADDGECGEGEGLTDGPPSTQSEVSIAVDTTGQ